jgi:predicted GTPase
MRSSPDVDHDKISNSSDAEVNIAIVGKTGSGRSSFINAIMG